MEKIRIRNTANKVQNTPKMDTKSETEKPAHLLVGEGVRDGQDAL